MNTSAVKKMKSLFENHPNTNTFFVTSDGMAFFESGAASDHATNTLKDGLVDTVTREDVEATANNAAEKEAAEKEAAEKEAAEKEAAEKEAAEKEAAEKEAAEKEAAEKEAAEKEAAEKEAAEKEAGSKKK